MLDRRRLAVALLGPPGDSYRLAARVSDPHELLARTPETTQTSVLKRLGRLAEAHFDATCERAIAARIWWKD